MIKFGLLDILRFMLEFVSREQEGLMCAVLVLVGNVGKGGYVGELVGVGLYGVIVGMVNDYR